MSDLHAVLEDAGRQWKDDVLTIAGERFERRLAEEIGALRIDMAKEFAAVRVEMAALRTDLLKWSFLFWIGQVAAVGGMLTFVLRTLDTR
jgi:hypothetical protein